MNTWLFPGVATRVCGAEGAVKTFTVMSVERVAVPFVAEILTMWAPALAAEGTVMVAVDEAPPVVGTTEEGRVTVQPLGADADKLTVWVNPFIAVAVMVDVLDAPALMFKVEGAAEIEKSGDGVGGEAPIAAFTFILP